MPFSLDQDKFILESYFLNGERNADGQWTFSTTLCAAELLNEFPEQDFDYDNLIQHIPRVVNCFRTTASVCQGKSPGRPSGITEDFVEDIRTRLERSPTKPLRQLVQQTGLSYTSVRNVVKRKLHYHPYKVSVVQEILPLAFGKRVEYCQWFNANLRDDDILDRTFFSDEAWFHLSGYVNSQNFRIWSAENPHVFHETQLHPVKIGVWIAMSRRRIIGPIFFQQTVNAVRYCEMLEQFVNELQHGYFQHDNASAHTAQATRQYIEQYYDNRVIGYGKWPPRSPDLTPLDYFMFAHLKNSIYRNRLHTLEELKEAIKAGVSNITAEQLINVFNNMKRRVDVS